MFVVPKMRPHDDFGAGYFGAARGGGRKHNGIDFEAAPETVVFSLTDGKITKIGYPYGNDPSYRYVQVTHSSGDKLRYFYTIPVQDFGSFELAREIKKGDPLGVVQNVSARYETEAKKMNNHVHLEIMRGLEYLNPSDWLRDVGIVVEDVGRG